MRRLLIPLLLVLLMAATGCTKPAETPPPTTGETAGNQPGGPGGPGSTPQAPGPGTGTDPGQPAEPAGGLGAIITAAPADLFRHHQIKAGEPIDRNGIFFMKTATGAVEGWTLGDDPAFNPNYDVSTDIRWVTAYSRNTAYLLDRKSGAAYQWEPNSASLVVARGDTLLFRTPTRFWLASGDLKRITPVDLKPVGYVPAVVAPDGRAVVLVNGSTVYLVDIATAAAREIGAMAVNRDYGQTGVATSRQGAEVLVGMDAEAGVPVNLNEHRVQRFDWTGRKLGEQNLPGTPAFSPDGRLVAWPSNLLGIADTMVVGTASDLTPRFRLVSIDQCPDAGPTGNPWLADGSGLVVRTGSGQGYQILGADGTLSSLRALTREQSWQMPVPAPDRADWFAVGGLQVMDRQGNQVAAAVPHSEGKWQGVSAGLAPWGETSDEVRFALINWGKDFGCLPAVLPPEVQMAPFPDITGLEVAVAAGDCVNLRAMYDLTAPVITCLPNGTRLTGSTPPGRLNKGYLDRGGGNVAVTDMGGDGWWYVRTDTGQRGWVRLSGEYLKLTAAQPGAPAADPVAELLKDETENLLWWISVAEGETECGPACAGLDSWEAPIWAVAEWCRQSGREYGYGNIRQKAGFDPARHEAGVAVLEGGCLALQSAWTSLGEPADTPAWREAVAKIETEIRQYRKAR